MNTDLEVIWNEQLWCPKEVQYVAKHVAISINKVVLLQSVQNNGFCSIKQTTDPVKHRENTFSCVLFFKKMPKDRLQATAQQMLWQTQPLWNASRHNSRGNWRGARTFYIKNISINDNPLSQQVCLREVPILVASGLVKNSNCLMIKLSMWWLLNQSTSPGIKMTCISYVSVQRSPTMWDWTKYNIQTKQIQTKFPYKWGGPLWQSGNSQGGKNIVLCLINGSVVFIMSAGFIDLCVFFCSGKRWIRGTIEKRRWGKGSINLN